VKIETTERGKGEHRLDYLIENAWWATIAFHLWRSGQFPNAFYFLTLLVGSHLLDEFAKRRAKMAKGRLLDDVEPFDRAFRLIAARRNVYVWMLAGGLFHKERSTHCTINTATLLARFLAVICVEIVERDVHDVLVRVHHAADPEFSLRRDKE